MEQVLRDKDGIIVDVGKPLLDVATTQGQPQAQAIGPTGQRPLRPCPCAVLVDPLPVPSVTVPTATAVPQPADARSTAPSPPTAHPLAAPTVSPGVRTP